MTTQRDLDRALDAFFEPGADEVADRVIQDALLTIEHTPQRRAMRVPWRFTHMSSTLRLATIAGVVVLAIGGGAWLLGRGPGTGVGGGPSPASALPTASPSPSPTPSPSVPSSLAPSPTPSLPSTTGWVTYTSKQYGYQIARPQAWKVDIKATRNWVLAKDRLASPSNGMNGSADHFIGGNNGDQTAVTGLAADVPAGMSEDAWLAAYYADAAFCPTIPTFLPITVDGHVGRLDPCYDAQALVFIGNRVYVFAIHRTDNEPLFRAFLSTVKFPASAPSSSPGASPSPS